MRCAAAPGGSRSPRPGPRRGRPGETAARELHVPASPAPRPASRAPARRPPRRPGRERARPGGRAGAERPPIRPTPAARRGPRAALPPAQGPCASGEFPGAPRGVEGARVLPASARLPPAAPGDPRALGWGPPWNPGRALSGRRTPAGARVCKQTTSLISLTGARAGGQGRGVGARRGGPARGGAALSRAPSYPPPSTPHPRGPSVPTVGPERSSPRTGEKQGMIPSLPGDLAPSFPICPVRGRSEVKGP